MRATRADRRPRSRAVDDHGFVGPIVGMPDTSERLVATIVAGSPLATQVHLETTSDGPCRSSLVPRIQAWLGSRRRAPPRRRPADRGGDRCRTSPAGSRCSSSRRCPSPPSRRPPRRPRGGGPGRQLSGALLSQNGDAVTSAFDRSDQALGVALAVARGGVLVSLVAIALADRWGRRRLILIGLVGVCAANLLTAPPRRSRCSPARSC